jgi:hypothetical protein
MSGWDWIHAGLEIATYTKARSAQQQLSEMKTSVEMEAARKVLLDAMRSFVFDISRDIQLAEEQLKMFPQQVYIVSKSLEWRLSNSGLSSDVFPDFQDKEYFFKTQRKITEVVGLSKGSLIQQQIQDSDIAVQYISEIPMLQQAILAKIAQESLSTTDREWRKLNSNAGNKNLFIGLGIAGLLMSMCVSLPLLISGIKMLGSGGFGGIIGGLILLGISAAIPIGSIGLFVLSGKSNPDYAPLKAKREAWQKQRMTNNEWKQVVATFGDLTSQEFQRIYDEKLAYLNPLLGGDFQKYLVSGE